MTSKAYSVIKDEGSVPIKMWTDGVQVEDSAMQQLKNVAKMPFVYRWVAAMPDVHLGWGSTVGSVIPTQKAIIPAAVGVDIGCGMIARRTSFVASDLPNSLAGLRARIEAAVPHGRSHDGGPNDRGAWGQTPELVDVAWNGLGPEYLRILERNPKIGAKVNTSAHLGTLGTGNHFIEVCLDEEDRVWLMLHSGSRGVGNRIGSYFISLAKEDMRRWFINPPDQDLAYLTEGTEHFDEYVEAVGWAQKYATCNRQIMMLRTVAALEAELGREDHELPGTVTVVNCHHNYVTQERHYGEWAWVTRKGAVRAGLGDLGIIPGSMGARSYIVEGLGNPESFMSCSHGAGRAMSRTEAKSHFSLADHALATAGIECRKDEGVLDETPGAYKDIDAVMAAQRDLVRVRHTLRQVVCVKG